VAVLIPFYVIIRTLNLLDTTFAVFLIHAGYILPFNIFVLWTYLATVPTDIEESALVDGHSRFETIRKVVFPVIWPGLVAISIFYFMFSYNEFCFAQLLTQTAASHTVPVLVAGIGGELTTPISLVAASGIKAMIPPIIIFIIFRRRIISGLAAGAVK
jgi:multiple sugar transport system permease protein